MDEEQSKEPGIQVFPTEEVPNPTVTILKGEAAPQKVIEPERVEFQGQLESPLNYVKHLSNEGLLDTSKALVEVDEDKGAILFYPYRNDFYSDSIKGRLQASKELEEWPINSGRIFSPKEMAGFIKHRRIHFEDVSVNMNLVSKLEKFSATVNQNIDNEDDGRGHKKRNFTEDIQHDIEEGFNLSIPLIKGGPRESLGVEIGVLNQNGSIQIWLESRELRERKEEIFKKEIERVVQEIEKFNLCVLSQ